MKKLLFTLLTFTTLAATAQKWKKVEGNGNVKKEGRSVGSFAAIESSSSISIDIAYGDANTVEVEADENILPHIITKTEGNKLVVTTDDYSLSTAKQMQVHIIMPAINELQLSGSGNITATGGFKNNGTTRLDTKGSGSIKLRFAAVSKLDVSVHGSGNVDLSGGKVDQLNAEVYGSGSINAYAIDSKEMTAKTNGSGNVKVTANESLNATANGSGNVYYKGGATNVSVKSGGSGKLVKG